MSNVDLRFVAQVSCNTAVVVGTLALLTGSTVLYSVSFTGMIVCFVVVGIYSFRKEGA